MQLVAAAVLALVAARALAAEPGLGRVGSGLDLAAPVSLAPMEAGRPKDGPSFVQQATGLADRSLPLRSEPGGGVVLAQVAAGGQLAIGGEVRLPTGLWPQRFYWARLDAGGRVVYGFAAADAMHVLAGAPLELDITGLPQDALLSPTPGERYTGGSIRSSEIPAGPSATTLARTASAIEIAWLPASLDPWLPELQAAGARHGVDPELLAIVTLVESGGNPEARSGSGALGLMQVMPATGADIARQRGISGFRSEQLLDPATNIDFGAWYLARQLGSFGRSDDPDWQQSVELAASAYNGGPGTVQSLLAGRADLPHETRRYRQWVGGMWRERDAGQSSTFEAWWWAGGARLVEAAEARLVLR